MSRVRENRMHGSKGRGWKRALATARGSEHRRETGGISATAYGSYRASPLPDLICKGPTWWPLPSARDAVREPVPCFYSHSPTGRVDPVQFVCVLRGTNGKSQSPDVPHLGAIVGDGCLVVARFRC